MSQIYHATYSDNQVYPLTYDIRCMSVSISHANCASRFAQVGQDLP